MVLPDAARLNESLAMQEHVQESKASFMHGRRYLTKWIDGYVQLKSKHTYLQRYLFGVTQL